MSKEREKYIRSLRLQGAVIFCSVLKNVMSRYWAHRSRYTLTYLRKYKDMFSKPHLQKRFLILLYLFKDKQSSMVKDAFANIKNKGTFLLLQRFFAKNINFSNGINHEVLFAIKNSAKTKNAHLNQLVQFWNISYCSEEPDTLEIDKPDREPFCRFSLENVSTKAQREHKALLSTGGGYNPRDPFLGQVTDMGIPYSRHKELIHVSFSGKKLEPKSSYSPSGVKSKKMGRSNESSNQKVMPESQRGQKNDNAMSN